MVDELQGAGPTSRRTRALVAAAALLVVLGVGADRWAADRERDRLRAEVVAGERVVAQAESSLSSLRQYLAGSAERPDSTAAERARAYAPVGRDAQRWVPRVQRQLERVRDLHVLPWHRGLADARDRYAERLAVVEGLLEDVVRAPEVSAGAPDATVRTRDDALDALRAAGVRLPG